MEAYISNQIDSSFNELSTTISREIVYPEICMLNFNASLQNSKDPKQYQTQSPQKKYKSKSKKGRKAQDFTQYQDQKILTLILKFGPKFKKISRVLNGKPVNIIKNRYYRHLRYKWDEILGDEYAFMNENKEKVTLQNIWEDIPLVPEYSDILAKMMINIQSLLTKCLNTSQITN